jgi:murein DD-endopeptidase MepM/ murein hydrolase activator NlpD
MIFLFENLENLGKNTLLLILMLIIFSGCDTRGDPLVTPENTSQATVEVEVTATAVITASSTPVMAHEQKVGEGTINPTLLPKITLTHTAEFRICSPLAEHETSELAGIISSPYDPPPMGKDDRHQGVDFAYYNQKGRSSIEGEGVTTIMEGKVAVGLKESLPYGNMVIIETSGDLISRDFAEKLGIRSGESLYHLYAHLKNILYPRAGEWIGCGELIGEVGSSGFNIPVAHLHLETRIGPADAVIEEMGYYDTRTSELARKNYEVWRMSGEFRHFDPMVLFSE